MAVQACQLQTRGFRLPGFHIPNSVILNGKIKHFCLASVVTNKEKKGNFWSSKTINMTKKCYNNPHLVGNVKSRGNLGVSLNATSCIK